MQYLSLNTERIVKLSCTLCSPYKFNYFKFVLTVQMYVVEIIGHFKPSERNILIIRRH